MPSFGFIVSVLGSGLLILRMWPRKALMHGCPARSFPFVSIVVPVRNEEGVLANLLRSLRDLDYPHFEVIVVNDGSTDKSAAIAAEYDVRLIKGEERPSGWKGKQWACAQGARVAKGEYLLFTDADTWHYPDSLRRVIADMRANDAHGFSALPQHACRDFWERICGPFHVLLLAATNPYGRPRLGQVYAIGQYLCFERKSYEERGGHERVKDCWVEDIPLARAVIEDGDRWMVYRGPSLFSVRMYESLGDFIRGWRRNFRAGMIYSYWGIGLEIFAFIAAMTGAGHWTQAPSLLVMAITLFAMMPMQASLGRFPHWGVFFFPLAIGLFCYVSVLALWDLCLKRPMIWKNRAYAANGDALS